MRQKVKQSVKQIIKENARIGDSLHNNTEIKAINGVPGRIRTCDMLLRRQPLYPAELQGRVLKSSIY